MTKDAVSYIGGDDFNGAIWCNRPLAAHSRLTRCEAFHPSNASDSPSRRNRRTWRPEGPRATTVCRCHDQPKRLPIRPVRRPLGLDRARLTAWRQSRAAAGVSGRTLTHDLREIFNAIFYLNRTGIPWRYLPHDFPPYRTVYGYFAAWSKEGIFTELNYELAGLVRDHHGRQIEPTASIMDTHSVKTSTNVPAVTQGTDAGKKILG
jgi:transposase